MQTIDKVLSARNRNEVELTEGNLTEACKEVVKNKGSCGVDKMSVNELKPYLDKNRKELSEEIRHGNYIAHPCFSFAMPTILVSTVRLNKKHERLVTQFMFSFGTN